MSPGLFWRSARSCQDGLWWRSCPCHLAQTPSHVHMLCWEPCWQSWRWEVVFQAQWASDHLNLCTIWCSFPAASKLSRLSKFITMKLKCSHREWSHVFASVAELPIFQTKLAVFKSICGQESPCFCVPLKQFWSSDFSCLAATGLEKGLKKLCFLFSSSSRAGVVRQCG